MATSHGITVVKNLCYTAPRKPKTKLPATENERTDRGISLELSEGEERPTSSRSRGTKVHTPKAMVESLKELQSMDEKDFYRHLLSLKKEHKKTLKTVEKAYYSELGKQRSGFDLDENTRISVEDGEQMRKFATEKFIRDDYDPYEVGYQELLESDLLPATDLVRDMSARKQEENKENQGRFAQRNI